MRRYFDRPRPLMWVRSSLEDFRKFPESVKDEMGYALHLIQTGKQSPIAKPLKGLVGVSELKADFAGDTYRAVYTAKFGDTVYVLHSFQKKAKKGIATPQREIELIKKRLRDVEQDYRARKKG